MLSQRLVGAIRATPCLARRGMASVKCSRMTGKVAVVTASTEGIGYAIAQRLAQEGAKVMISSRKEANVLKAVKQLQEESLDVNGCVCHVGKPQDRSNLLAKTMEEFGRLDVLVSNATVNPHFGDILDSTSENWDKLLEINIKSAFLLCKESVPHLEKNGGGNIVLVSSIAGYVPMESIAPYSVCKTALLGLVKALVPSCSRKNIRVNGIAPGIIKTNFSKAFWSTKEAEQAMSSQVPLSRLGVPEECGAAVAFLASDDASYVTGETLVVAGGLNSHL